MDRSMALLAGMLISTLGFSADIQLSDQTTFARNDIELVDNSASIGGFTIWKCLIYSDYICINCDLSYGSLSHVCSARNLSGSNLAGTDMEGLVARDAAFDNADMGLALAFEGDFRNASFYGTTFYETRFDNADFEGAQFKPAGAFNSEFHDTNMRHTRLRGNLREASFLGADFTNADLAYADMRGTKFNQFTVFSNTNVHNTNFRGVNGVQVTFFTNTNLVGMIGIPKLDANIDWQGATCPDGSSANSNGATPTCEGHFVP